MGDISNFSIPTLLAAYSNGADPRAIVDTVADRINSGLGANAWIYLAPHSALDAAVAGLERRRQAGEELKLFGIPFGVKDNIDVAGMPTTASCPDFSYWPERSARCVDLLLSAGALCIGKTNLDQFATGLSGTRSPYGACASIGNSDYLSGGSSSGSAVAVAAGHISFALGTDTGGSGRIPAGFNGIVGLKPTVGRVSSRGLVPNCPSIDCPSIFAKSVDEATRIFEIIDGFDKQDPYSRRPRTTALPSEQPPSRPFSFGRLAPPQIETFGMPEGAMLYEQACERLQKMGGTPVDVDFEPFREAGRMLFDGPWIAERRASLGPFADQHQASLLDVIRTVLSSGQNFSAIQTFSAMRRLRQLRRQSEILFESISTLLLPTAPRPFTIAAANAKPIELNNKLGYYSYHANLLDLCAISVPNGILSCGVPMGVTFLAPAWSDAPLAKLAKRFEIETQRSMRRPLTGRHLVESLKHERNACLLQRCRPVRTLARRYRGSDAGACHQAA